MDVVLSLAGVVGALLIGAISPGPSFLLVARTSMAASRADGMAAALGMGIGAVLFSILVLFGLQIALSSVPWLYAALKILGGFYLGFLAIRIWRGANAVLVLSDAREKIQSLRSKSFFLGLVTQLSNPKTAVVYGGIFTALLPRHLPPVAVAVLPAIVFVVEAGWYALVAIALSTESSRVAYQRSKKHVDRVAAGLMGFLGLKLVTDAPAAP